MTYRLATWERESSFHDEWAVQIPVEERLVYESFESPLALEGQFVIQFIKDFKGKKVLDIGSGLGESSTYFAIHGADVTIVDISSEMIKSAKKLAHYHGVRVSGIVSPAENFDLPENTFDFCYAANILHHVTDHDAVIKRIERALKPGGVFVSWDPLVYNPLINVYRRMTRGKVRTTEEEPLTFDSLGIFEKYFQQVDHKEFWLFSNIIFLKYFLFDRLDPNQTRYWKHILNEKPEQLKWMLPLLKLDKILLRHRLFQYFAWTMLVYARKSK